MNSPFNINRSNGGQYPTGPSNTPDAGSPTGRRTAPATSSPLHARGLPGENMAPRGALPSAGHGQTFQRGFVRNSFSNAAHHAHGAMHDWSQGVNHRVQQHSNGLAAYQAQTHPAWYPHAGGQAAAKGYLLHQNYHRHAANQAYASASNHAHAFFGHAAQGVKYGVLKAAHKTASLIDRFDPRRMASQAARYGSKVMNNAGKVATAGVAGLMFGGAVAHGVSSAVHHAGHMAHAAGHAAHVAMPHVAGIVGGLVAGPLLAPFFAPALGHVAGHFAGHVAGHVAGHAGYHGLSHAASAFCHNVAQFDPFHWAHGYRPFR